MVNNELLEIIFLTLRVSGSALAIACVLGIPFGLILGSEEFRGKKIIQLLISTGMGLPPVVVGLVVYLLLSNQGPLGTINWLFSPSGMILSQSILAFPLAAGFTSSAIAAVSPKLIIQIRSMGTTSWQEKITIFSQARNGIIAAVLAAFWRIISEVGAVMLVGGNIEGHTRVLSTAIVLETRQGKFAFALSLGFVLLGIALLANSLTYYFGGQWEK
ncbi:MAG: ABC transporter permease [Chloroflexi bacterium]|nr:ABC transporter permease [Chloroflexota bacterium]